MLAPAASFRDAILAIHILAVVVAFGVTFAYPIFDAVGARMDRRAIPRFHRMQGVLSRRVIGPGLVVVLIAGVYWPHTSISGEASMCNGESVR